jgi:putative DNA primase/helicase
LTPVRGKRPILEGWPKTPRPTEAQVRAWAASGNLGVLTGSASGIIVIDADSGSDVTPLDLPETWTAITGGGGRHFVYAINGGSPIGNSSGKLGPHIDVKGEGGQIVLAGSIHPSTGALYQWAPDLGPDDLPLADLPAHIAEKLLPRSRPATKPTPAVKVGSGYARAALAEEAAAVRDAPAREGNDQLNRSAFNLGQLVGAGALDENTVIHELMAVATPRRPETEARGTIHSGIEAGKREPRKLPDAKRARPAKPQIKITLDVRGTVDQARDALILADVGIYQRVQSLVRVIRATGRPRGGITRAEGAPIISEIGDAGLLELLTDCAEWIALKKAGEAWEERPAHPPRWARGVLLERGDWPGLRYLGGIVTAPTMRPDGSILDRPGHDETTGMLFDPCETHFPAIKAEPTRDEARSALIDLAEPFLEFCFADQNVGLAGCIVAVLSIVGRPGYDGPAPMFAVRSTTPGSGKDLMACGIGIIGTGREPARTTAPRGKEADGEWRKRILAHALAGDPAILIGNVDGALGSPTLADTLTKTTVTERMLGENRNVTVPMAAVWLCTGNGITFRGDLGRRVVPIDLNPGVEHPEDRTGPRLGKSWTHADLLAYIGARRPHLVSCALMVLRAFHVAGRPGHGKPLKGSFEAWDRLVRSAVIWAGGADPLDACEAIREEADADLDALRAALSCWREALADRSFTAAEAVREAKERAGRDVSPDLELVTALAGLAGCDVAKLDPRALGNALRRVKNRPAGGLRFHFDGENRRRKVARWRVEGTPTP